MPSGSADREPTRRTARSGPARAAVAGALALLLGGCGGWFGSGSGSGSGSGNGSAPTTATLPSVVGKGMQYAFDELHDAGFPDVGSHDASGRARFQMLYRDWKVCFQSPAGGRRPTSVHIDLAVVKLGESCPKTDQGLSTVKAGAVMPDLRRHSARFAAGTLGGNASIIYKTRSGEDALVLVDSNWEVCEQTPKPGQAYGGAVVTLVVAKYSDGGCAKS